MPWVKVHPFSSFSGLVLISFNILFSVLTSDGIVFSSLGKFTQSDFSFIDFVSCDFAPPTIGFSLNAIGYTSFSVCPLATSVPLVRFLAVSHFGFGSHNMWRKELRVR